MATPHEHAWDRFQDYIDAARKRIGDTFVPVALVCLQADPRADGQVDIYPNKDNAVIWPAELPVTERGPLLARLAKPYFDGTVLRS